MANGSISTFSIRNEMADPELVAIARVVKPRGLRGECVADILTDFPERFADTAEVIARSAGGDRQLTIRSVRFDKDRVLIKFDGVDDIDSAEQLRNAEICVPETDAVELEDDEFFDWELEGCRVETVAGETIGTVRELMRTGATEILVVAGVAKEYLVPFAETICVGVDVENKMITIDPPEGLLDF